MSKKPIIALTPQYNFENTRMESPKRYTEVLDNTGALPVILPIINSESDLKQYAEMFDGFLFTGGEDVNPIIYGEKILPECGRITDYRDSMEIALMHEIMKLGKPILGICRGIQVLNVGMGGSLIQHMEGHMGTFHSVELCGSCRYKTLFGSDTLDTNSFHHQSVKSLGSGLKVGAYTSDGIIEEIHMDDYPYFVGLQWHPEILNSDGIKRDSHIFFSDFVRECS